MNKYHNLKDKMMMEEATASAELADNDFSIAGKCIICGDTGWINKGTKVEEKCFKCNKDTAPQTDWEEEFASVFEQVPFMKEEVPIYYKRLINFISNLLASQKEEARSKGYEEGARIQAEMDATTIKKKKSRLIKEIGEMKREEGGKWDVGVDDGMGYDEAVPYNQAIDEVIKLLKT